MARNTHRRERGQALMLFVLLAPLVLGMVGLAIDFGVATVVRADAQEAADAAALAAAQELPDVDSAVSVALDYASNNGFAAGEDGVAVDVMTPYHGDPDKIEVTITTSVSTVFMRVVGTEETEIFARAVVEGTAGSGGGTGYAFLALNQTACRAFDKSGSSDLVITNGGGIMVNSSCDNTSNGALNRTAGGDITAATVDYYEDGTVTESGSGQITPAPSPVRSRAPDPLWDLPVPDLALIGISPDSGGTAANPAVLDVGSDPLVTLRPGVYYGGIKIASGGNVIFEPGTYVIAGGGLAISGSGDVTGNGVFFYNTNDPFAPQGGPGSPARCQEANLRGSAGVALSAPTSGTYENILLWQDVNCDKALKFEGGSGAAVGAIYVPGARIDIAGSGPLGAVQLIADTFDIAGSGTLTVDFVDYVGIPIIPPSLKLVE